MPDGLLSSGDLVMSINNPYSEFSENRGATTSGMAGNEESLTMHEFRERDSPVPGRSEAPLWASLGMGSQDPCITHIWYAYPLSDLGGPRALWTYPH